MESDFYFKNHFIITAYRVQTTENAIGKEMSNKAADGRAGQNKSSQLIKSSGQ